MRTSFHHQPEAQHPKSSSYPQAGRPITPSFGTKRTLASDRHPIAIYEYTLARASQLRGDLEAKGPRLTRRDDVVGVRRGPIALVEDVLDIELRLPGRVDLREDAGVEAQEARQVDAVVGRRVRIREVDGAERGGPDRIDLILVPPRELMERNELNAVAGADGGRGVARHPRSRRSCQAHPRVAGACRQGDRMRRGLSRGPALPPET